MKTWVISHNYILDFIYRSLITYYKWGEILKKDLHEMVPAGTGRGSSDVRLEFLFFIILERSYINSIHI